jgi:hypothetical protein
MTFPTEVADHHKADLHQKCVYLVSQFKSKDLALWEKYSAEVKTLKVEDSWDYYHFLLVEYQKLADKPDLAAPGTAKPANVKASKPAAIVKKVVKEVVKEVKKVAKKAAPKKAVAKKAAPKKAVAKKAAPKKAVAKKAAPKKAAAKKAAPKKAAAQKAAPKKAAAKKAAPKKAKKK